MNAVCRIFVVDGDHRVAIVANKDLEAGEELTYDYNYSERVGDESRRITIKSVPETTILAGWVQVAPAWAKKHTV
jgi:SET domain-containing protein